jgi:hypothetical protein
MEGGGGRISFRKREVANAFLSPGVNSQAELVPSHGAPRRWLGDYNDRVVIIGLIEEIA